MVDLYRFMKKSHAESFMAGEIYRVVDHVDLMVWPKELARIGMPKPYQWDADSYTGWGDRASFQNKVIEIDGGKQRMGFNVGGFVAQDSDK